MATTFVAADLAARDWARSNALISAVAGTRIYLEVPKDYRQFTKDLKSDIAATRTAAQAKFPFISVSRIGGAPPSEGTPLDDARISFQCWGASGAQASQLAAALVSAVYARSSAVVLSQLYRPDTDSDLPRYVVDVLFKVRAHN